MLARYHPILLRLTQKPEVQNSNKTISFAANDKECGSRFRSEFHQEYISFQNLHCKPINIPLEIVPIGHRLETKNSLTLEITV